MKEARSESNVNTGVS